MKDCSNCKQHLPFDKFHVQCLNADGSTRFHTYCKDCRREKRREDQQSKTVPCECGRMKYPTSTLCRECRFEANRRGGPESPSWRGGEHVTTKGYVTVLDLESGKRHLKHRLVMEEHLGRKLLADETVHHKNGKRSDNRIENLELWCSNHPPGQRVEDLVTWAKMILDRFG